MRPIAVNLDELAFLLHRGPELEMECFLNLDTAEIINIPTNQQVIQKVLQMDTQPVNVQADALLKKLIPDSEHFVYIPDQFTEFIYDLMCEFAYNMQDKNPKYYEKLYHLIHRGGSYKTYRKILMKDIPLYRKFISFRDSYFEVRARAWLEQHELTVIDV